MSRARLKCKIFRSTISFLVYLIFLCKIIRRIILCDKDIHNSIKKILNNFDLTLRTFSQDQSSSSCKIKQLLSETSYLKLKDFEIFYLMDKNRYS